MASFRDEIRRRVQEARESHNLEEEERRRRIQQEAQREEERRVHAKELLDRIPARMRQAAEGSDGAIRFAGPLVDGIGRTAYDLYWEAPPPGRGLRVSVNYFDGIVEWTWLLRGEEGRRSVEATDFSVGTLDRLILALTEQAVWASRLVPAV